MPNVSGPIKTFGESDVYSTGDANRQSLGFHSVNSILERNQIPIARRRGNYQTLVADAAPKPFFVSVRIGSNITLYWLKNEPGTTNTTDTDWEEFIPNAADPFQGFFIPNSSTLVNGAGTKGHYWIASVSGSHDFGAGIITFAQYDEAKYDGSIWQKVGGATAVADWNTMINKPIEFPSEAHNHSISEVTSLQTTLDNKIDSSVVETGIPTNDHTKIPSSHSLYSNYISNTQMGIILSNISTYGIKFAWIDQNAQDSQTGQNFGDLGLREDEQIVYRWEGVSWEYFFALANGGHSIQDSTDTVFPQRGNLKFEGATVYDDPANDRTVIEIIGDGTIDSVNGQTGVVVLDTDDIAEPVTPTNKWFTESRVLSTVLNGLSLNNLIISATDTILSAFGKIQGQLNANLARFQNSLAYDATDLKFSSSTSINTALTRNTKLFSYTGITHKNDTVELTVFDANTVRITALTSAVFWNELFVSGQVSDDAFKSFPQKDYALVQLVTATGGNINQNPITTDGLYVRYLGYDKNGNVVSSAANFLQDLTVAQLGFVTVIKSGATVTFLGGTTPGARNVFSQPILASSLELDRTLVTLKSDIVIGYNTGAASLKAAAGSITGLSINWRGLGNSGNSLPIDKVSFAGAATVTFASINPLFLTTTSAPTPHTLWTETEGGIQINRSFFNTTTQLRATIGGGNFSVKRVLVGTRGGMWLQDGEHATTAAYATMDAAKAALSSHAFTDAIIPPGVVTEIARIAFRENVTDFTNANQFFITSTFSGAGSGTGTGTTSFAAITGNATDNTSLATELGLRALNLLTGYTVGVNTAVLATDTVSQGIGKVEKKVNDVSANKEIYSLYTDPDVMTTSAPVEIRGTVSSITAEYDNLNNNTAVTSTNFVYNYRDSASASWTTGVTISALSTALINSSTLNKRVFVTATNTVSTVPACVTLVLNR